MELARQTGWDNFLPLCRNILVQIAAQRGEVETSANRDSRPAPGRGADWHRRLRVPTGSGAGDARALAGRRRIRVVARRAPVREGPRTWTSIAPRSQAPSQSRRSSASATFGRQSGCSICSRNTRPGPTQRCARSLTARAGFSTPRADDQEACNRCARGCGRRAGTAARGESVRAGADAPRARNRAAPGAAQARRPRYPRTGGRDLRAARRAPLVGEGALGAAAHRRAHRSKSELSETERRIVELVVAGRRNREVAAELSLSPNTVAWNLSKISNTPSRCRHLRGTSTYC